MTSEQEPKRIHEITTAEDFLFFDIEPLITAALNSLKHNTDKEGAVEWCRPAARKVVKAVLKALEEDGR